MFEEKTLDVVIFQNISKNNNLRYVPKNKNEIQINILINGGNIYTIKQNVKEDQ